MILIKTLRLSYSASDEKAYPYLEKLKDSNKEIIIIDHLLTKTSKFFKNKATQIRTIPNTDVAMMLGMAYHLYNSNKYDKQFIENYTVGFDRFLPYLLGKTDKTPKTPKWASEICGVSVWTIKALADYLHARGLKLGI